MAELATYVGIEPRTEICNVDIARGLRAVYGSNGQLTLAPNTVRGDYVTLVDGKAGETVAVASMHGGGKVGMVAALAVAAGDPCYGAANGQVTSVATGAAIVGRFTQPARVAGVLTEVELESVL